MSDLQLVPGTLAQDCYPASPQALYEEMFARGHAVGPNVTGILIQDAVPDPADIGKGWIPTSGGVPRYPGYIFVWHATLGHWVSRHEIEAGDIKRYLAPYPDTLANLNTFLQTYDGGDAGPSGPPASGPMWEVDLQFAGSVPIGVGLIPSSSPAASIVQGGDTQDTLLASGEYKHSLTTTEGGVGDHVHPIGWGNSGTGELGLNYEIPDVTTPAYTTFFNAGAGPSGVSITTANLLTLKANDGNGVVNVGHNNMQPYVGVYFLKRTSRVWIVAA